MITWESWSTGRKIIHRESNGRFLKGNFHKPLDWLKVNTFCNLDTRNKISVKLKGIKFSEERKENISIGTKKSNYKWAKGCKHGIVPINSCRECMNEKLKEWRHKKGIHVGYRK